jgi:hypothetical protein
MAVSDELPETAIKVYARDWVATIFSSEKPDEHGFIHVTCHTVGSAQPDALRAAEHVLNAFAFGRVAFIRTKPETEDQRDHRSEKTIHRGYVRFSYKLELGEWKYPVLQYERLYQKVGDIF